MLDNFHFTIVKSAKDNCLRSDRYFALNWDQLVALTANHTICEAKDGFVKMFIPASFRTEQDRYDPARYDNGDPIINRRTGQPYVRRCAENLIEYPASRSTSITVRAPHRRGNASAATPISATRRIAIWRKASGSVSSSHWQRRVLASFIGR